MNYAGKSARHNLHLVNAELGNIVLLLVLEWPDCHGQVWVIKGKILVKADSDYPQLNITTFS